MNCYWAEIIKSLWSGTHHGNDLRKVVFTCLIVNPEQLSELRGWWNYITESMNRRITPSDNLQLLWCHHSLQPPECLIYTWPSLWFIIPTVFQEAPQLVCQFLTCLLWTGSSWIGTGVRHFCECYGTFLFNLVEWDLPSEDLICDTSERVNIGSWGGSWIFLNRVLLKELWCPRPRSTTTTPRFRT